VWWREVHRADRALHEPGDLRHIDASARIATGAVLDMSGGPIIVGPRTVICRGAHIVGPVTIGADCLIGNAAMVRGTTSIGDGSRIGFASELKNAILGDRVMVGPQCFIADSVIEDDVYLGAQVRTSNHRLDGRAVEVMVEGTRTDTGHEKLGCRVGAGAALGIQVIILPGREIAPGSVFGPRITVEKNLPVGRYRLPQQLETY
jgi:bifunctional UDP-N-acetylglucosamine pyrophosphorylase/glucosamine-1-phosphate N-acetyltransferase